MAPGATRAGVAGAEGHGALVDGQVRIVDGDVGEVGVAGVGDGEAVGDVGSGGDGGQFAAVAGGSRVVAGVDGLVDGDGRSDLVDPGGVGVGDVGDAGQVGAVGGDGVGGEVAVLSRSPVPLVS